jgi:hypothetical protein
LGLGERIGDGSASGMPGKVGLILLRISKLETLK